MKNSKTRTKMSLYGYPPLHLSKSATQLRSLSRFLSSVASGNFAEQRKFYRVLNFCFRYAHNWRVPPNWSRPDWSDELLQTILIAGCEAARDFDRGRNVPFSEFLRSRIMARTLKKLRKEWIYALRFTPDSDSEEEKDSQNPKQTTELVANVPVKSSRRELLDKALRALSWPQRKLIKQLFWDEMPQEQIGAQNGVTQRAISKQKHAILKFLRRHLRRSRR